MKGYNKLTCVKFNEITTEKHLVFALCEKLRQNGIHIQQEKVYTTIKLFQGKRKHYSFKYRRQESKSMIQTPLQYLQVKNL